MELKRKENEEKPKKTKRGRKSIREGKQRRERKKGEEGKREKFPMFRWSKLDGPRIKGSPRNESYAWVPKSVSFVKL